MTVRHQQWRNPVKVTAARGVRHFRWTRPRHALDKGWVVGHHIHSMHILMFTIGSAGDVFPFIALGLELQRRGHRITLMTGEQHQTAVRAAGMGFAPMYTEQEFNMLLEHPDFFHPRRGIRLFYREMCLPWVTKVYQFISSQYVQGQTGVITSTFAFGARVAQEKLGVPVVTVHLQPTFFRSIHDTPIYPGLPMKYLPRQLKSFVYRGMDKFLDGCIAGEMNAFRATLGLPAEHRYFANWIHSPTLTLGLFPSWFVAPQPDWPAQAQLTGFPLYDGIIEHPLSEQVSRFLEAGDPPVVFTIGTPTRDGRWFFEGAVEACRKLGCRGLLVHRYQDQIPPVPPPGILHAPFVPFGKVFSRSRAVVHHGGIGTLAQVFAAGVPQVVVPIGFDRPDNAARMERLGVGFQLPRQRFSGASLADALRRLLNTSNFSEKARQVAGQTDGQAAVAAACDKALSAFGQS